jgi:LysR family transcriptional regulator, nitrogen assimilation regulatory protein
MHPRNLHSFMKVVEYGTFNRAAAQLHVTQPALSRRIGALEDELGTRLFDRSGRGVTLTDAGMVLRDHAEGLLRHVEQVRSEIQSRASTPTGTLSVGLPSPFRTIVSRTLVPQFCIDFPKVKLHVFENTPQIIQPLLLKGALELGVIFQDEPLAGLVCEPFLSERLFLAGAPHHGLRVHKPVPPTRLAKLPLVQAVVPSAVRAVLSRYCAAKQIELNYNVEVDSIHLMMDIAASGHSFTVLPYSAIREQVLAGTICAAPLSHMTMQWVLARPADRHVSSAARRFADALRRVARSEVENGRWPTAQLHG